MPNAHDREPGELRTSLIEVERRMIRARMGKGVTVATRLNDSGERYGSTRMRDAEAQARRGTP